MLHANITTQLGGVTLTTSILYLAVAFHRQSRQRQAHVLQQQELLLRNVVDPQPLPPPTTAREPRAGLAERAKDMWNAEIEGLVRRVYEQDWNAARARWENRLVGTLESTVQKVRETGGPAVARVVDAPAVKREG
jgi:altered-inheritance-of-mitochondria protein 5